MSQGFSIGGEAFGFGGSFSMGGEASTAKNKRNARISLDTAERDRGRAYRQALTFGPRLKAAEYQAMRDAGLHPAFTGGGGTGSAPILAGGVTGPGPGRSSGGSAASFKIASKYEALINEANLGLITARIDEVRERIEASQYARRSPGAPPPQPGDINITADPQTTTAKGDKSLAAATNPAWHTKTVGKSGASFEFLGDEISDNFENPVMALAFVERNKKKIAHYGLKYLYSKNPMAFAKNVITWLYNQSIKPGNKIAQARKYDSRVDSRSPVRRLK